MQQQLHYRGDLTRVIKPGKILGYREPSMIIWEVTSASFDGERTTVNLDPASREALVAAGVIE
jgi:hypothetical protein